MAAVPAWLIDQAAFPKLSQEPYVFIDLPRLTKATRGRTADRPARIGQKFFKSHAR